MIILAIETSCDDTCISIVEAKNQKGPRFKILSNIVSSQIEIHKKWGGVYPTLAKREHQKNLPLVFKKALKGAKLLKSKIDLIGVTVGPGLEPCLWVGVNFAKNLAENLKLPIIPINHIEAHILANWLQPIREIRNSKFEIRNLFPAVCLVVSGGHTQLILMKNHGDYKILGETRDDAAGECFDKVARILGLGYPGGPMISKLAKSYVGHPMSHIKLPRPMIYQKNYDFSFSGLKTAVLYHFRSQPEKIRKSKRYIQEMSAETQQAVVDVLIHKTLRAARNYKAKTVILGGGVAANDELRKQFKTACLRLNLKHLVPPKNLCTDNAAMMAATAYYHWLKGEMKSWGEIEAEANLRLSKENVLK